MRSKKLFATLLLTFPLMASVTACSGSSSGKTIRVLNLEDYIYINNPKDGYDEPNLTRQFEIYASDILGYPVHVIYDCSDTNESEYNDLLTGRISYDLVCTSDYMLQRFVREGLVSKLDKSYLTNYNTYASKEIKGRLDEIEVKVGDKTERLEDYAVGYMWGTLGLLVNPNYPTLANIGEDQLFSDLQSWDILWNNDYYHTASIKNSMRDTYAVALMHVYEEQLEALKIQYQKGEITPEQYNIELGKIFNLRDEEVTLPKVKEALNQLKGNIFGLEVDSGKQDIITGKIGINLAWSGDAVYSMDQAEDLTKTDNPQTIYYAVPENGSNIWFDGWAMPKNDNRDPEVEKIAMMFLDYLSTPEIAYKNMDYTGYTSFIGGDDILDLVTDWYDERSYLVSTSEILTIEGEKEEVYFDIMYEDPITGEEVISSFDDCKYSDEQDPNYDEVEVYYYNNDEEKTFLYDEETGEQYYYNDWFCLDELEKVDLSYFFDGTLTQYTLDDCILLTSEYYSVEGNISVGRQFFCQYPDEETINRCSVMEDYGEDNVKIVKLWEDFKSNPVPMWGIILLIIEAVVAAFLIGYFYFGRRVKKKLRIARSKQK